MRSLAVAALLAAGCSRAGTSPLFDLAVTPEVDATLTAPSDPLPTGAISFFRAPACPVGWTTYVRGAGRFLVASSATMPTTSGTPLASGEDRAHHHAVASSVTLTSTSYVGVVGGGNGGVTAEGNKKFSFSTDDAGTGLPYIQLLVCQKIIATQSAHAVPHGTTMFYPDACPTGWSPPASLQGRLLVSLPDGAQPGTFGGAPLALGEQRPHMHAASGSVTIPSHGIALAGGCCGDGYGAAGTYDYAATSDGTALDVPMVQLRQCIKD